MKKLQSAVKAHGRLTKPILESQGSIPDKLFFKLSPEGWRGVS